MIIDQFQIGPYQIHVNSSIRWIQNYLKELPLSTQPLALDIGAHNGLYQSNSLFLYFQGWHGLCLEKDPQRYQELVSFYSEYLPWVQHACQEITPDTIVSCLEQNQIPQQFDFLSLDIDSYDADLLKRLLQHYQPSLICAEINEVIPPPIAFAAHYASDWQSTTPHFFGMSLTYLAEIAANFDYQLIGLDFNNAFLVRKELNPWPHLSAVQAYKNYREGLKPQYNLDMHDLLSCSSTEAMAFLKYHFKQEIMPYTLKLRA